MSEIRGVLLDVDGTLLDSNDAHARSWVDALAERGIEVPYESVRPLIGKGGDKLLPEVSGIAEETPMGKEIGARRWQIFQEEYLPSLRPCRGARDLLLRLQKEGYRLVVATSAKEEEVQHLLAAAGVADLIEKRTSSSDAEESKPDPDIVHAALTRSGLAAEEVVMLGDTPYDVEAAGKAGVRVVALRCGGWDDPDLAGADAVYGDPADLLARFGTSLLSRAAVTA